MPALCSGRGTLFGGAGHGSAIEALERTTGRPLVWATAQYLSYARPPSVVEIAITEIVRGHRSSQARAIARVDGEEIFTVTAALGSLSARVEAKVAGARAPSALSFVRDVVPLLTQAGCNGLSCHGSPVVCRPARS